MAAMLCYTGNISNQLLGFAMTLPHRFFVALTLAGVFAAPASHAEFNYRDLPNRSSNASNVPVDPNAANQTYERKVGDKALNGLANIGGSAWEIPKNVINTTNDNNIFFGLVGGTLKGILNGLGRLTVGAVDLVTAPIPTKPVTYPLRSWENTKVDTSYGNIFELDPYKNKVHRTYIPPVMKTAPRVAVAPRLPEYPAHDLEANKKMDKMFKQQMMK
jgi:putative exosortase-associated protein (TIGR04073 family)